MATDRSWRAVMVILLSERLAHRGEIWNHVDLDRAAIHFDKIFYDAGVMSRCEQQMIRLAASFFDSCYPVNLYRDLSGLDSENMRLVQWAIEMFDRPMAIGHPEATAEFDSFRDFYSRARPDQVRD